jgi:hypothetical protein
MSPAGIVMTYVSEDAPTALHETANEVGTYAIGTFRTRRDIRILDLAELPPVPSLFEEVPDSLEYDPRRNLVFLHLLARDTILFFALQCCMRVAATAVQHRG